MTAHMRILASKDGPSWTVLFRDCLSGNDATLPAADLDGSFALLDPQRADRFGLVAVIYDKVAGIANCTLHGHNLHAKDVCYLQEPFVAPAFRGAGIDRRLIGTVYAEADAPITPAVYRMTQRSNPSARHLQDCVGALAEFIRYVRA